MSLYCHCEECVHKDLEDLDIMLENYEVEHGDDEDFIDEAYDVVNSMTAILRILDETD